MPCTKEFVAEVFAKVMEECNKFRESGQKEYARDDNALANFENLAKELNLSPEAVLWVYVRKHIDGIASHIRGNVSQREDVRGRINDVIVYMVLLRSILDSKETIFTDCKVENK